MTELTLAGMRVVQEVAARGSFTAAAEALSYTQSAVSRQVAAMEEAAGAALFERLPRGVRPTSAGSVLLRHAAVVLERVDAAGLELGGLRDRLEGRLAVGAFPTALAVLVPAALAQLQRDHPAVLTSLREGTTPAQLRRLRAGRIELAVIAADPDAPHPLQDLRAEVLLEGRLLVAVPATHRLAGRGVVDVAELEHEPWIVGGSHGPDVLLGAWPGTEWAPRIAYTVRDWSAKLGFVAAGLGLTVVPGIAAAAVPAGVELVAVEDPAAVRRSVLAVTRLQRSPGATALLHALREQAARIGERMTTPEAARRPHRAAPG